MSTEPVHEIFIFPLNTVLYPEGALPLKVFEQRYVEMTKACLRAGAPFGVCLIREGLEVGAAAVPEPVGCFAAIERWDMPHPGLFHLLARGGGRFRIREMRVAPNQLISASVETIPADRASPGVDRQCREMLQAIIEKVGAAHFPAPARLDDAAWVGFRLAEILPLDARARQALLEMTDATARLERLRALLAEQGLAAGGRVNP